MDHSNNFTPQQHEVIALAGLLQCSQQVSMLAHKGQWNETSARSCIHSLFQMEADSVIDVYGSILSIRPGLQHLLALLQKKIDRSDLETTRYALSLLHLERKLKRQTAMLNRISQRLYAIKNEFDITAIDNDSLLSRIADTYLETISTIPPKIQVEGSRKYLTEEATVKRVRVMLFSGIRAAVLWHQLGGSRWLMFFHRQRMLRDTRHLLEL